MSGVARCSNNIIGKMNPQDRCYHYYRGRCTMSVSPFFWLLTYRCSFDRNPEACIGCVRHLD
jgi:hypothetical protein